MHRFLHRIQSIVSRYSFLTPLSLLVWAGSISGIVIFVMIVFLRTGRNVQQSSQALIASAECENEMVAVDGLRAKLSGLEKEAVGAYGPEILDVMRELLDARVKYLGDCGGGVEVDSFYPELRRRYETAMAADMDAECRKAEEMGQAALTGGNFEGALRYYSVALRQQGLINEQFPSADQANVMRAATFSRKVEAARIEPMLVAYHRVSADADSAYGQGDYELARSLYTQLRSTLIDLSYKVPKSYLDSDALLRRVERRIMDTSSMIRGRELDNETGLAQKSADEGDYASAADAFSRAMAIQRSIESDFPASSLASPSNLTKLDRLRQDVLAKPLEEKIDRTLALLEGVLRSGECARIPDLIPMQGLSLAK